MSSHVFEINNNFKNRSYFLAKFLKILAQKNRLQVLLLLNFHKKLTVTQLIDYTELSQTLISHHLQDLRRANLVKFNKKGRACFYSLTDYGKKFVLLLLNYTDQTNQEKVIFLNNGCIN
jgi:DNA-binding transcriptional ArsR family regulator